MKNPRAIEKFQQSEKIYRCPLCHRSVTVNHTGSFLCANGHCFDISSKGYVNFIPAQQKSSYDRGLFESRRRVLADGYYDAVVDEILAAAKNAPGKAVLDAGCGEGFYAGRMRVAGCDVFAADIEKEAVKMAARSDGTGWMVADLANLPIADNTMDMVLNVLSPANYGEFGRVLKEDGILLKVVPGSAYLEEIRAITEKKPYEDGDVEAHFTAHVNLLDKKELLYKRPVTPEHLLDFVRMTPLARHIDVDEVDTEAIDKITIHLILLTGRMHGRTA